MDNERHWHTDLISISDHFWFPFRSALRDDLHEAMALVSLSNLSFAQRLESTDKRQLARFSACLAQAPFLRINESAVVRLLSAESDSPSMDVPDGMRWLAPLTVLYLHLCRSALIESYELAFQHFRLTDRGFARLLIGTPLGSLLELRDRVSLDPCLRLHVSVPLETMLDRVLDGVNSDELAVCRVAHYMSIPGPGEFSPISTYS